MNCFILINLRRYPTPILYVSLNTLLLYVSLYYIFASYKISVKEVSSMRDWKIIKWMFICVICVVPYLTSLVIPLEIPNWYGWFEMGIIAYFFGVCLFAK